MTHFSNDILEGKPLQTPKQAREQDFPEVRHFLLVLITLSSVLEKDQRSTSISLQDYSGSQKVEQKFHNFPMGRHLGSYKVL